LVTVDNQLNGLMFIVGGKLHIMLLAGSFVGSYPAIHTIIIAEVKRMRPCLRRDTAPIVIIPRHVVPPSA
jgi:hypothetical protein